MADQEPVEGVTMPGAPPAASVAPSVTPRPRRTWPLIAAAVAAAVAIVALVWLGVGGGDQPELVVEIHRGTEIRRSDQSPAVGDTLVARVQLAGPGELRVYRNDSALLARCPGHAACRSQRDGRNVNYRVEVPITSAGRYRAAAIAVAGTPLTGSLDGDLQAARDRGASVVAGPTVDAR